MADQGRSFRSFTAKACSWRKLPMESDLTFNSLTRTTSAPLVHAIGAK